MSDKPQKQATAKAAQATFSINTWLNCSQRVQLLFDGEKCVLLLSAWKPAFLKSGHISGLFWNPIDQVRWNTPPFHCLHP